MTAADPSRATHPDPALELDVFVAAFEAAAAAGKSPDPGSFLPPPEHPLYDSVLRELVRVDLELAWSRGVQRPVEAYRDRFPDLFRDPVVVRELVREEFRLRKAAGECPEAGEYRERLGLDVAPTVPEPQPTHVLNGVTPDWPGDRAPTIGDTIPPGYHLTAELGRGAFGRVFLAREMGLGGRPVAVKLSTQLAGEPVTLARLQHTNIVPVYAAHRVGRYTALVMPYVGRTTLGDLLDSFRTGRAPQSGRGVISTLADRARSTAGGAEDVPPEIEPLPAPGGSRGSLEALERMSFVEAVLWIGAELADGLAHAHERGVLHRDIKPANVLFTDDGRPMLLDFNLAAVGAGRVAGTPGYMAPEQLAAAAEERGLATPRTDIYALGLVLVELLAGQLPFEEPRARWEEALPKMIAARKRLPLDALVLPSDVTPGVRAILAKCLDPDPGERYASAADLREDLKRQRTHQPLKFARDRSIREQARKWARRHPRLTSGGTIAVAALLIVGVLSAGYLGNRWRLQGREAELAFAGLRDAREFAQSGGRLSSAGEWRAVRDAGLKALAPYGVESDDWVNGAMVERLPHAERSEVRRDASQVMYRTAEALSVMARENPDEQQDLLTEALEWNRRASAAFPVNAPRPHLLQRVRLLTALGKTAEADAARAEAQRAAEPAEDDLAAQGFAALEARNYAGAAAKLRAAASSGSPRYSVWMGLAAAEKSRQRHASAIEALAAASALRPESAWPYFHRGIARMELKDYPGAAIDLDRFLEFLPDNPDGLLNRAIVRLETRDYRGAIADLDRAERAGSTHTRLYRVRELAKRGPGDTAGADRDRAIFLAKTPTDPLSWCARGELKLELSPPDRSGALADFDEALHLDEDNLSALRDKASVMGEDPGRRASAITVLDRVLELAPASVGDRAGRAVLLARTGRSVEAVRDVDACLAARPGDAMVLYQLASAALVAGDKPRGLTLLRACLRKEPSLALQMPTDTDLQAIWKDDVFLNLLAAARTLSD